MKILITGATGLIGNNLCAEIGSEGHHINILSRNPERLGIRQGIGAYKWNPEEGRPPEESLEGVDCVVHLAGEPVVSGRWTEEQKRRIRDSRVIGTRNLVDAIKASGEPNSLICASAVGYYGDRGDEPLDENSAPGRGYLSEVCVEWEREAMRSADSGVRVAMVRIGIVLSTAGGALEKMLLPFKLGLGGRLGDGKQWFPWIHEDDIVAIFKHAINNPLISGPLNGVSPGIVTNEEFTKQMADALSRPVFFPIPEVALKIAMGEMATVVLASQRITPRLTIKSGFKFEYDNLKYALASLLSRDD